MTDTGGLDPDIAVRLRAWLSDELGRDVAIGSVRRTSAGFSRENWVFDATWDGVRHDLIARRDPVGSVLATDRAVETAVVRAMQATMIPSPTLRWVDLDGARLGRPSLVMDMAVGDCDGYVLNRERPLDTRVAIAHELYDALADIHRLDWRTLGLAETLDDPGSAAALAALDHWESELVRVKLGPEPELAYVIAWLRTNAPVSTLTTLVHGDFKPGNVLLDGDRLSAVLDWETAHLGDPHEDLGWVTNPVRAGEHRIADHWEPAELLARWSARTGWQVDPDSVRWWQVLANVKLAVIVLSGIHAMVDGRLDRIMQSPVSLYRVLLSQIAA